MPLESSPAIARHAKTSICIGDFLGLDFFLLGSECMVLILYHTKPYLLNILIDFIFLMKVLVEIDPRIWGKVKDFATIRDVSLSLAVAGLLREALAGEGYALLNKEEVRK
jgi:hypothetical protein